MKKITCLLSLLLALTARGQDFAFSQFYEMPMLRNPALSGIFNGDLRISSAHRSQWGSISVPYQTTALGIEYKLPAWQSNNFFTLGMQLSYDVAGDLNLKKTQVLPVLTYHQLLNADNNMYLSGSFMAGSVHSQFDPSAAKLDDQFVNGEFSPSNVSAQVFPVTGVSYFDMSGGLVLSATFGEDSHYYLGAALFHVNKPLFKYFSAASGDTLARKLVLNAGLSTPVNDRDEVIAYLDYYKQGGNQQVFGGLLYETTLVVYDDENDNTKIAGGIFYRWNDALIPTVKLTMRDFMLGLSYDVNVSQLKTASQLRGGLELTLSFLGFLNKDNSSRHRVQCPGFGSTAKSGWFSTK